MKLSRASGYALHALAPLVEHGQGRPLASQHAAQARGIPERFLLKLLQSLVGAGVLISVRGPGGGYRLAGPTNKITLLGVVEAVDGPIRGSAPLADRGATDGLVRRLLGIAEHLAQGTRKQLKAVTLADLVGKVKRR